VLVGVRVLWDSGGVEVAGNASLEEQARRPGLA
jgi:hypothetical protein